MRLPPLVRLSTHQQALTAFTGNLNLSIVTIGRASHAAADHMRSETNKAEALQNKIELILALTGLVAIFGAALIARRLSRSVIDPVVRLQEASRKLGAGDFSGRVEVDRADEVGALARTFNTMADDLEQHEADLKSSQDASSRRRRWKRSASSPAASPTTSTTCCVISAATPTSSSQSFADDDPGGRRGRDLARRPIAPRPDPPAPGLQPPRRRPAGRSIRPRGRTRLDEHAPAQLSASYIDLRLELDADAAGDRDRRRSARAGRR